MGFGLRLANLFKDMDMVWLGLNAKWFRPRLALGECISNVHIGASILNLALGYMPFFCGDLNSGLLR